MSYAWGVDRKTPASAEAMLDRTVSGAAAGRALWGLRRPVFMALALFMAIALVRGYLLEVYVVVGDSMQPSLQPDQHLLVSKLAVGPIERSAVLVFAHPSAPRRHLVKRVVGLPGETVSIEAGRVFVSRADGPRRELGEGYLEPAFNDPGAYASETTVPEGCYYVLGDNRENSKDSRNFGVVFKERIIGRALFSLWPPGLISRD